jgi:hypothetical protein
MIATANRRGEKCGEPIRSFPVIGHHVWRFSLHNAQMTLLPLLAEPGSRAAYAGRLLSRKLTLATVAPPTLNDPKRSSVNERPGCTFAVAGNAAPAPHSWVIRPALARLIGHWTPFFQVLKLSTARRGILRLLFHLSGIETVWLAAVLLGYDKAN